MNFNDYSMNYFEIDKENIELQYFYFLKDNFMGLLLLFDSKSILSFINFETK